MSFVGQAFVESLGKPNPAVPHAIHFDGIHKVVWELLQEEIGAGWYKNRFLYLFGPGLERLQACPAAWSFLAPAVEDRIVLGYNAHGAILVLEGADTPDSAVRVLDPVRLAYWGNTNLDFVGLLGNFLPNGSIPHFLDTALYDRWVAKRGAPLEDGVILAPKVPLPVGGKLKPDNFREEDVVSFYQTTAPIFAKAVAQRK